MESEKSIIDNLIYKAEIETQTQRINVWIPSGESGDRRNWETGIYIRFTLLFSH